MLRIGLLMPRSTLFPAMGLDILNSLKAFLAQENLANEVHFIMDNIGFGIDDADIYTKAEKMLLQDDADVVIAMADQRVCEMLEPLFMAANKMLLLIGMGANFPDTWQAAPNTLVHSLNFSFLSGLTGTLAAEEEKKGAYAVSYYDAGHRQCYAMVTGHQLAGGIPSYTHVTHFKEEEFSLQALDEFFATDSEVHNLMCLFAGDLAEKFYQELPALQSKYGLHIFASPMLLDESLFTEAIQITNVKGYVPWVSTLENESNRLFKEVVQKKTNKAPGYFGLLGWETGIILKQVLHEYKKGNGAHEILSAISNIRFDSPRGWFTIDASTFYTYGQAWLMQMNAEGRPGCLEEVDDMDQKWRSFTAKEFPKGESSSWKNTYLCV